MLEVPGKKRNCYVDDLLWVVRSQEAADLQLKQYNKDQGDQFKAESGKVDANRNTRKMKTCFSCGPEGHLSQGKWCLVQGIIGKACSNWQGLQQVQCDRPFQS